MWDLTQLNWLAVLVAAVVSFVIGGIWYGAFSKQWMRYSGVTEESIKESSGRQMALLYGTAFATYFVAAAVLALLLSATGVTGMAGAGVGLLVGVGLVAAISFNNYLFAGRPFGLYLIDTGYPVVALFLSALILGLWQ